MKCKATFMRTLRCLPLLVVALTGAGIGWTQEAPSALSADEALKMLMKGNERYVSAKVKHPDESLARRKELTTGQHPFAIILGCADSRVAPELLFDEGLGDLFVIRVAGNIVDDAVLGSIEYAVEHLGTKLIVVLGHEKCGAVTAAIEGGRTPGHLAALTEAIRPAVDAASKQPGDTIHNCVIANVQRVAQQIRQSEPVLKEYVNGKGVKVVAADYDIDTGRVRLLGTEKQ
jgi:carbonic anhydrase